MIHLKDESIYLSHERSSVYTSKKIKKAELNHLFSGEKSRIFDSLPETMLYFQPIPSNPFWAEQKNCETEFWEIFQKKQKEGELNSLSLLESAEFLELAIQKETPSCFYFYRKIAPVLVFQFDHGLDSDGLLVKAEAEIIFRTTSQGTGNFKRQADADLLIPMEKTGWVDCMNKNKSGFKPTYLSPGIGDFSALIWTESYHHSILGKLPGKETFLLRLKCTFQGDKQTTSIVLTPYFLIKI